MIKILSITPNPLTFMGEIANICYGNKINTKDKLKKLSVECINSGHHRVLEYVDMTICIENYSARMVRELYTHHTGVSRLQESTRYVDYKNFDFYIPASIKQNSLANDEYISLMDEIQRVYFYLLNQDIPKQDIANILPLGMMTKVVLKINLRALLHMAEMRLCNRALKEYKDFMYELKESLRDIDDEWEYIIDNYYKPKCEIIGYCTEKQSCHKMPMKSEIIK